MKKDTLPQGLHFVYHLNPDTEYFERKAGDLDFRKLPLEIKVEKTRDTDKIRSVYVARSRKSHNRYFFFTGLLPIYSEGFYFGDQYEYLHGQKVNSFILFEFSPCGTVLTIDFFNFKKVYPKKRNRFVQDVLRSQNRLKK